MRPDTLLTLGILFLCSLSKGHFPVLATRYIRPEINTGTATFSNRAAGRFRPASKGFNSKLVLKLEIWCFFILLCFLLTTPVILHKIQYILERRFLFYVIHDLNDPNKQWKLHHTSD